MAKCQGEKQANIKCAAPLYRCKKCGNVGCSYGAKNYCTKQAFLNSSCLRCGTQSQLESIS